jgi:UDP-glucuronate 4-epimerase
MLTYDKMHFFSTPFFSEPVQITHVMHLAAQAAVRYAMANPGSYVRKQHCSTGEYVSFRCMQACESTAIHSLGFIKLCVIWVVEHKGAPFSELDQTDQSGSLYAATKKAGEEIALEYI